MRTTLSIDDDVLIAARAIARQAQRSIGEVVSDLARRALHMPRRAMARNGTPLLPRGDSDVVVTLETVKELHDALP
jgi:negative regulator of replication initiation